MGFHLKCRQLSADAKKERIEEAKTIHVQGCLLSIVVYLKLELNSWVYLDVTKQMYFTN